MYQSVKDQLQQNGFAIIGNMLSHQKIRSITDLIDKSTSDNSTFRRSADLFAIRQFLKEIPAIERLVFIPEMVNLLQSVVGDGYNIVKAIYFDKPPASNWLVPYHQDLTTAVKEKHAVTGFAPWTVKQNQYGVQPPVSLLQNIITLRIHLDDTNENNYGGDY